MISYNIMHETPFLLFIKRVVLIFLFFYFALTKLPEGLEYMRPEPFVLYLLYRSIYGAENDFTLYKAWFLGAFANICYPVYFGSISLVFVSACLLIKIYHSRLVMYSAFQLLLSVAAILLFYQVGFYVFYKDGAIDFFGAMFWKSYCANIVSWSLFILATSYNKKTNIFS